MQITQLNNRFLLLFLFLGFQFSSSAQTETRLDELKVFSKKLAEKYKQEKVEIEKLAKKKGWPLKMKINDGGTAMLTGIYPNGLPEYTATDENIIAAATISTDQLWAGGSLGLNLDGSSANMKDKLAIWDGGRVRNSHIEFGNRIVFGDNASTFDDHATHVAGTMIAKGINSSAKGMAFNAQNLIAYDFNSDNSEMSNIAGSLLLSNHSYGSNAGWVQNSSSNNRWEFWGEFGANEDFKLGFYDNRARQWDSIAFLAPQYLIIKSAGNKRNTNGPAEGTNYWRFNATGAMAEAGQRPSGISSNNSYDILPTYSTAKNILTIGAVNPISSGYQRKEDVVMSSFTSWGPADDGRVKPDVVANGVNLTSTSSESDNSYNTKSGTSMSSPNASGSLFLLQEYFNKLTGTGFLRSASLKGLVIHTADEAGFFPGPDYQLGWGLINTKKAAEVITGRNSLHRIIENNLTQGNTFLLNTIASGTGPLVATICWTDPPGIVDNDNRLNNRMPKLINDLDIEITQGSNIILPWKLDGSDPTAPATRDNNILDNVEKIEINNPIPGEPYLVKVKHKGTLLNNAQAYSLILSGIGGSTYCISKPTDSTNARIDKFKFSSIDHTPAASCRMYSNFTHLIAAVYGGQTLPLNITLGTCNLNKDKIAKIFIDWNGNGNFTDANELVATSTIINGTGNQTFNITVPLTVKQGITSRIRIVCMETSDANQVSSCGIYTGAGETQDYLITFTKPPIDVKPMALSLPDNTTCATDSIYLSVQIKNLGIDPLLNIPVTLIIKNAATTVATYIDTIKQLLLADASQTIYLSNRFNALPGINYQFTVFTSLTSDLNKSNDTMQANRTFLPASPATLTNAKGHICSAFEANLSVTSSAGNVYWYDSPTSTTPIGTGNTLTTNIIPSNKTYYIGINDVQGKVGPPSKSTYPSGSFSNFLPVVNFETFSPMLIESARFFNGSSGKLTIKVSSVLTSVLVSSVTLDIIENQANDEGTVLPLNLKIPDAGSYTFTFTFENGATSYRHNGASNNVPYPFTLPGLMRISGNNQNPATSFYYYLYDLKVKSLDCPKPLPRLSFVATNATIPTITQNGNVVTSSVTTGILQWYLNGSAINGATNSSHTMNDPGVYTVSVTKDGCFTLSAEFNAIITSIPQLNPNEINLTVSNNPGNGAYNLMFNVKKREKIFIEISNINGQLISREEFTVPASGSVQRTINLKEKSSGVYLMKIYLDNKQYIHKLIKE